MKQPLGRRYKSGVTLLELLVFLIVLIALAAVVLPRVIEHTTDTKMPSMTISTSPFSSDLDTLPPASSDTFPRTNQDDLPPILALPQPPLCDAASKGDIVRVRYLLRNGANPNCQDDNGYTPLLIAADDKRSKMVRLLLTYGANPNVQTRHYQLSPLIETSAGGDRNSVQALLRYGADVRVQDMYGWTALKYARYHRYFRIVRLLKRAGAR